MVALDIDVGTLALVPGIEVHCRETRVLFQEVPNRMGELDVQYD